MIKYSKKVRCWPINSSLKNAKLLKTQNLVFYWYQTFLRKAKCFFVWNFQYNTQETFLWHKLLLCDLPGISSLLLPHFAVTCNHKSKIQLLFTFFASITHSNRPLGKHILSSEGSKGHVCRLLADFDPCLIVSFVSLILSVVIQSRQTANYLSC